MACARDDDATSGVFSTCDNAVLATMPNDLAGVFPAIMASSNEGGLSRKTIAFIQACSRMDFNIDHIRSVLLDMHMSRYVDRKASFEASAAQAIQMTSPSDATAMVDDPKFFSTFDDPTGYSGFVPPSTYLIPYFSGSGSQVTDVLWTGTVVVTAMETAMAVALPPALPSGLSSVCASAQCLGFVNCRLCQDAHAQAPSGAPATIHVATTPANVIAGVKVSPGGGDPIQFDVTSSGGAEPVPSTPAASSNSTPEPKRKRRPRRCQNREMINGEIVVCGLMDCPGRGGQRFCKNFVDGVKLKESSACNESPTSMGIHTAETDLRSENQQHKLTSLVKAVQPAVRESERVAMEALQNMI
jgi:hypothetical protein